jgi:hypothetical protein
MDDQCGVGRPCIPAIDPGSFCHEIHRAAWIKASGERGTRIKAIALMIESPGTTSGIDVCLEYGYI